MIVPLIALLHRSGRTYGTLHPLKGLCPGGLVRAAWCWIRQPPQRQPLNKGQKVGSTGALGLGRLAFGRAAAPGAQQWHSLLEGTPASGGVSTVRESTFPVNVVVTGRGGDV